MFFQPGGQCGERCLINGYVNTASEHADSVALFRRFTLALRDQFAKVKSFYVGPQAARHLKDGWRLTASAKAPPLYDLR